MTTTIPTRVLPHGRGLPLPVPATGGSVGLDLRAALEPGRVVTLGPGERVLVPTGLAVAIPVGFEGQIRPRSGLAFRHGLTVANAPGTIDADYRGELKVALVNHGRDAFEIKRGHRVAQLVVCPVAQAVLCPVESLPLSPTARGGGGFGSTGVG